MVIWQDIFGSWLPFSAQQKKKIKSLKNILSKYHKSFYDAPTKTILQNLH